MSTEEHIGAAKTGVKASRRRHHHLPANPAQASAVSLVLSGWCRLPGAVWGNAPTKGEAKGKGMRVLVRSNDPVRLSFLTALLNDAGIGSVLLDTHASLVEGSIGAIQRRLAVAAEDEKRARRVLADAGEI
jgi:hypothetical protein